MEKKITKIDKFDAAIAVLKEVDAFGSVEFLEEEKERYLARQAKAKERNANATGYDVVIGLNASGSRLGRAIAIGNSANASGGYSIAVGASANTSGNDSIAIGEYANSGNNAIAIGGGVFATADNSVAIGHSSNASGIGSTAIGYGAKADDDYSIVIKGGSRTARIAAGGTSWTVDSDEQVKENIELGDTSICLKNINAVPVKRYTYKGFVCEYADKHQLGFIAQDLEKIYPKLVFTSKEESFDDPQNPNQKIKIKNFKRIEREPLIPVLWGGVQELSKIINEMQNKILELEKEISEIKA